MRACVECGCFEGGGGVQKKGKETEGDGEIDSEKVEDALVLTDAAHCKKPTLGLLLSLDAHTHTYSYKERETPLAYALKCVIRLSPSRF